MTAKQVLNKIMLLLSKDVVSLAFAKLKDGTIVESPTFDVGEELSVISEDGEKSPAPDGEHELSLRDTEGKETLIKVITKGGKIEERENVELAEADLDVVKVEEIPQADGAKAVEDVQMAEETEDKDKEDMKEKMKEEKEVELRKMVEKLAYRIEEMEKKMVEMGKEKMKEEEEKMKEEEEEKEKMEEEKLPKLNGAPIETKMSSVELNKKNYGKNIANSQSSFLSKLYK